jgi:hypothetical protein
MNTVDFNIDSNMQKYICIEYLFYHFLKSGNVKMSQCYFEKALHSDFEIVLRNWYLILTLYLFWLVSLFQDWSPTPTDILHSRAATKGVYELNILINSIPFKFIDVGGQRSQRSKWLQCFDGITSLLFMVAASEFDQVRTIEEI